MRELLRLDGAAAQAAAQARPHPGALAAAAGQRLEPPFDGIAASHLLAVAHLNAGARVEAFDEYCREVNAQAGARAGAAPALITRLRDEAVPWLIGAVITVCNNVKALGERADAELAARGQEPRCLSKAATTLRTAFASVRRACRLSLIHI